MHINPEKYKACWNYITDIPLSLLNFEKEYTDFQKLKNFINAFKLFYHL